MRLLPSLLLYNFLDFSHLKPLGKMYKVDFWFSSASALCCNILIKKTFYLFEEKGT